MERLRTGPAFRFTYLLGHLQGSVTTGQEHEGKNSTILMAASHSYIESIELVHKTVEALHAFPGINVLMKFHPDMGEQGGTKLVASTG